jgi:hypothetical protein
MANGYLCRLADGEIYSSWFCYFVVGIWPIEKFQFLVVIRILMWFLLRKIFLTKDNLAKRRWT